jgi:hypothetical protein
LGWTAARGRSRRPAASSGAPGRGLESGRAPPARSPIGTQAGPSRADARAAPKRLTAAGTRESARRLLSRPRPRVHQPARTVPAGSTTRHHAVN